MQAPLAAFAADPAGGVVRQPSDEVVALRLVAVPPSAFDTLRAGEQREFRLGQATRPRQEPERSSARLPELARIPFAGLDPAPGMLGPVVGLRGEAADCFAAETDAQAPEQPRPVLLFT